jgi:transposase
LQRALTGRLSPAQRFVLRELLDRYDELEATLSRVSEQIKQEVGKCHDPFVAAAVELLQTIPGIGERVAQVIVSEIGVDMRRFATDGIWRVGQGCVRAVTSQEVSGGADERLKAASTCAML